MLTTSTINSTSFTESSPSPIKAVDNSLQIPSQQLGGTSLLMHSSFGVPRRHSDDVTSTSFTTTTTFRPRRSISSSAGQQQTRHVVCIRNNYSHSLPNQQQGTNDDMDDDQQAKSSNNNLTQEDSFNDDENEVVDDEEDMANELNLAVVVGNEDIQSLKEYTTEPIVNDHGSLDVAFIDETDIERNLNQTKAVCENDQATVAESQQISEKKETENLTQTIVNEDNKEEKEIIEKPVLVEKTLNKETDLDEILRRNEHRCIRLTDSDVCVLKFLIYYIISIVYL